jgi:hypothetical protein
VFFIGFFWLLLVVIALVAVGGRMDAQCHADTWGPVYVSDEIPDASRLAFTIQQRLRDGDEISVAIIAGDQHGLKENYAQHYQPGTAMILMIGSNVYVRGNDWMPQTMLDDLIDRVKNVNHTPKDIVISTIDLLHQYQQETAKPAPPPPPPPPPGPPAAPEPSFDWSPYMIWIYVAVGVVVLAVALTIMLRIGKKRYEAREALGSRALEQADWGADKYGVPYPDLNK